MLLGLAAGMVIGEAVLRVLLFSPRIGLNPSSPGANHPQYLFMPCPGRGYCLRPFFQGRDQNFYGDFHVPIIINSMAMRSDALEARVCGECLRVLMLGDSLTYGEGVSWEEAYPARAESILNHIPGQRVQVMNGGVPGYSVSQSFERLKDCYDRVRPGIVTLAWSPGLFARETVPFTYFNGYLVEGQALEYARVRGDNIFYTSYAPGSVADKAEMWFQSHSFLYLFLKYDRLRGMISLRTLLFLNRMKGGSLKPMTIPPLYLKKPMDTVVEMNRYCSDRGSAFIFILLKSGAENEKQILDFCRERGIRAVSLVNFDYLARDTQCLLVFKHDAHFNREGHERIARGLAPLLAGPAR